MFADGWATSPIGYTYFPRGGPGTVVVVLSRTGYRGPGKPALATIRIGTVKLDSNGVAGARPGDRGPARARSERQADGRADACRVDAGDRDRHDADLQHADRPAAARRAAEFHVRAGPRRDGASAQPIRAKRRIARPPARLVPPDQHEPALADRRDPEPRAQQAERTNAHRCRSQRRVRSRRYRPGAVRIGVAKEIKSDEYRVALTPAGALELINHGHEVTVETGAGAGSSFAGRRLRAGRRLDRPGRRGLGLERAPAQGQGADRGRVRPAARGAHALHLPAHRGRRAADARARRLGRDGGRLRDGRDGARSAAAARADVRGRGPAFDPGGRVLPREAVRRPRASARRRARSRAGAGRDHRRRDRRLQRGDHGARARRRGDDPRALDRPDAAPRGDPVGPRDAADVVEPRDRGLGRGRRSRDRRGLDPGRARAEARDPRDDRRG